METLSLSYTKIKLFLVCPQHYAFYSDAKTRNRFTRPQPHLTMGSNIHGALYDIFKLPENERTYQKAEEFLRARWRRNRVGFKDTAEEKLFGERALRQLQLFFESQDVSVNVTHLEGFYSYRLRPDLKLIGRIDRAERSPQGSLIITDYKTGKVKALEDKNQLLLYALIFEKNEHVAVEDVRYLYLEESKSIGFSPTRSDLAGLEAQVFDVADEIQTTRVFDARPGLHCRECNFLDICPKRAEVKALLDGMKSQEAEKS
ncbi:MAG: PD-(D/E)XK nuclease family protein [Chlorobiales bacterium]|jgi:putative RecB family exonuclease|nr:PD-(D/E)XK nuclease family protein [Chlorobiales bacterium]